MEYQVKNVCGSASRASLPQGYSSWLNYWESKTNKTANYCSKVGCLSFATDGAHVTVEGYGNNWYIVPLCHKHNMETGTFEVYGPLVPVNPYLPILW
jgi:hypothetical protein